MCPRAMQWHYDLMVLLQLFYMFYMFYQYTLELYLPHEQNVLPVPPGNTKSDT